MHPSLQPFFFFKQTVMCLSIIIGFVYIIVGCKIIEEDRQAGMLQIKVGVFGRRIVLFSKLLSLVVFLILFSFLPCIISLIYDYQYGCNGDLLYVVKGFILLQLLGIFWSVLAMAMTYYFRGSFTAASILLVVFYLESYFVQYIPDNVAKWFPMWNIKSILYEYCPKREGMIAIIQRAFNTRSLSITVLTIIFVLIIGIYVFCFLKKDLK